MKRYGIFLFASCLAISIAYYVFYKPSLYQSNTGPYPTSVLGEQTKTANCVVRGPLPDLQCTPGAIFPDATVEQICASGYSSSVRNVSTETKREVYQEYGIYSHVSGQYEVDHLISLELGGSNDIANLWPEAADPKPGFHEKDEIENYLHDQVCTGKISLQKAQEEIATDWTKVYQQMPR